MNKAITALLLTGLFTQIQSDNPEIKDISQDIDSDDSIKVIICRTPGDAGSFSEPQNVSISKNILKPETVKVYCEEYIQTLENKAVQVFKEPGNVFHLALVMDKEEVKPVSKAQAKNNKAIEKEDPKKPAKDLVESLVKGKMNIAQQEPATV